MLKRLGVNIQDALLKIKDDQQFEYRDLVQKLENKFNKNILAVTEDVNAFGNKWDSELQRFQVLMNKKLDDNESDAHKEFAKLLDESMQAIEDSLNNNVIQQLRKSEKKLKDLEQLGERFEKSENAM